MLYFISVRSIIVLNCSEDNDNGVDLAAARVQDIFAPDDCDKVLKAVGESFVSELVALPVKQNGFACRIMELTAPCNLVLLSSEEA